jgi:hypothetical protein
MVTQMRLLKMPVWGSAGRPSNPRRGDFGFNAETNQLEIYNGYMWKGIG